VAILAPVIITRVINNDGRAFNVRLVREGDRYGRDAHIEHDSAEPLIEFWDATYERDPHFTLGLGQFAARYGFGTLIGLDGYSLDHRSGSPGLNLCDHVPEWKVSGENVMTALASAEAALAQVDSDDAEATRCALCDEGHRRYAGVHWTPAGYKEPCARVAVVYDDAAGHDGERWLAYVDGKPLRRQNGDPRRYASADIAHKAALTAAPKRRDPKPGRPPPRAGTTTALVLEIISHPRDFPWLTTNAIVQIAAERGIPVKSSTVSVALSHLHYEDLVEVDRTRMPFRYRRGLRELAPPRPKITDEMRRVLLGIKSRQWGLWGNRATLLALVRRGLVNETNDQGSVHYEVSAAGAALLEDA